MNITNIETDVLIVGGGPSGTAAALSLLNNSNTSVVLVEQSALNRLKVGEHVSSSFFDLVKYLNIEQEDFEPNSFIKANGMVSYWGSDLPMSRDSAFTTQPTSYQLDREKFDSTMLRMVAEKGGRVFPRTKCTQFIQKDNKHWKISLNHKEYGEFEVTAKFLIDATGRQLNVGRQIGIPSKKYDDLMGVGVFLKFEDEKVLEFNQMLESTETGWWYSAVLPNNIITTIFFSDSDIVSKYHINKKDNWNNLLLQTKHIKHRIKGTSSLTANPWIRKAFTHISDSTKRENFLAIGDAAASFDPISSMGIGFAISSACQAAKIVQDYLQVPDWNKIEIYQKDIAANFEKYLKLREQFYHQEKRWSYSDFWIRRNTEILETTI